MSEHKYGPLKNDDAPGRVIYRVKKIGFRLASGVRKFLRKVESKLDEAQPHPALGILIGIGGVLVVIAGIAMIIFPGPGWVTIAAGAGMIIIGVKVFQGKYGPERKRIEREEKRDRMQKLRDEKQARMEEAYAKSQAEKKERREERKKNIIEKWRAKRANGYWIRH